MKSQVKAIIKKHKLIDRSDKIVIGVSGGHDSMTLLYVLEGLKEELDFEIAVAHINHGIRGAEADADEDYVRGISKDLGLEFYSLKANMDEYAKEHKLTSEEAGREIRYDFFRQTLKKSGGNKIAVAHNKDDQAETLLMRFMRGTGIDGLRGMEFKTRDIIRPILDVERSEIEKYCEDMSISPRIDKTNMMPIYGRNKVRLELIPYIEKTFNSNITNTLARTSEIMKVDSDFLMEYTEEKFMACLEEKGKAKIVLDIGKLDSLHKAVKTRVIRRAIEELITNLKGIEKKHIEDICKLINNQKTGKKINLTNNIIVTSSYENLIIEKNIKTQDLSFNHRLGINTTTHIEVLASKIKSNVYPIEDVNIDFNNKLVKCFDYDNIKSEIYVRNRKNGDRFSPIGMIGSKKLKSFFIDEKIPKEERDKTPLILEGENIIWVVGHRISEDYKVTSNTSRVLVLEYIK